MAQRGQAVHAGHHQVQHDQVGAFEFKAALEGCRAMQHRNLDALAGQVIAQQVAQLWVVVNNQYLGSHSTQFILYRCRSQFLTGLDNASGVTRYYARVAP